MKLSSPSRAEIAGLVTILLVAAFLRLHALDDAPPGLTHDEADHGRDAARVLEGIRPIYFTVGYGREPLYDYTTALTMLAVGRTGYASRLTAALYGLVLIPLVWAWARRALGAGVALLAAALMAAGFWPVMVSRQALRSITLPVLLTAAVYWWWRRGEMCTASPVPPPPLWGRAIVQLCWGLGGEGVRAGVLLGATFYTYLAARVMWVIFPAMLAYLAVFRRDRFKRAWRRTALVLLIAAAVSAPLFAWLTTHPDAETRIDDLSYPLDEAKAGNFAPLRDNIVEALRMFTARGDGLWMYNLPGRPLLAPVQGALFVAGVAMALVGALRGRVAPAFLLIWLLAGMVPNMITGVDAAVTRAVGLMPALYVLPAWAFVELGRVICRGAARVPGRAQPVKVRRAPVYLAVGLATLTGVSAYHDYFDRWNPARDVRVAYHHTLIETVAYLDASADTSPVMLSSITPEAPHDPAVVRMTLHRDDLALRWFDARRALLFPDEETVRVTLPEITPLDGWLAPYFADAEPIHRLELRPDDFNRTVDIYEWHPRRALREALPSLSRDVTPLDDANTAPALEFLGYTYLAPDALVTFWRALDTYGVEATDGVKLFVHAVGADGEVAQEDRLDAPAWTWQPGDVFAQVHRVDFSAAVEVYVGAYDRDTGDRLTIIAGGGANAGQRLRLGEVMSNE